MTDTREIHQAPLLKRIEELQGEKMEILERITEVIEDCGGAAFLPEDDLLLVELSTDERLALVDLIQGHTATIDLPSTRDVDELIGRLKL